MDIALGFTADRAPNFYESGDYSTHNRDWHAADAPWKAAKVHAMLTRNGVLPGAICDIGCGTGGVLHTLRAAYPNARLIGRDIAPAALAQAEGIDVSLGGADGAPHSDVAMALDVFEHVDDYPAFLRAMRGLAPVKIYHVPLDISLMALLRGSLERHRETLGHIHVFTAETALAAIEESGQRIVDVMFTCGPAEQPRGFKQRLAAMPRRLGLRIAPRLASKLLDGFSIMALCH